MKVSLSQNIRDYRKKLQLTQEQLAEAMSVSVATVSKWERGGISPDPETLAELADFFNISVDVLLGYEWKTRSMGQCAEHIRSLRNERKYAEGSSEAHKALPKYPHCFPVVYECGKILFADYMNRIGERQETERNELVFLLETYNHALELFDQNEDKSIRRESLYQDIGNIYALMGEKKKAVEYLEEHNEYHVNDHSIGVFLSQMGEYDRALEYISETFRRNLIDLCVSYEGCVNLLINIGKYDEVIGISGWMKQLCVNAALEGNSYFLLIAARADAIAASAYAYKSVVEKKDYQEQINYFLECALRTAYQFDRNPDYEGKLRFFTNRAQIVQERYEKSAIAAVRSVLSYSKEDGEPFGILMQSYNKMIKDFDL